MSKIGFLEDDKTISLFYKEGLKKLGFESSGFPTIASFIAALPEGGFDLLLLDWFLPDGHADTVIEWVRDNLDWQIPIVVVSATEDEDNIVNALWLGADDYLVKPVSINALGARLHALLRRTNRDSLPKALPTAPYSIDIRENRITLNGEVIPLTQKEFDLAFFLFENVGKLVSRVQVLHKVWGQPGEIETRTIDAHVSRIKKKLRFGPETGWRISAVYGYGYRLERTA